MNRLITAGLMMTCVAWMGTVRADEAASSEKSAEQKAREEKFCKLLTGATLVGSFTVSFGEGAGPLGDGALKEDRYKIDKVTKGKGNFFLFEASIGYQGKEQVFRMPVEVQWAGDTPVITMTKILVPGMGTFTARVLFYDDHYAGFWSAGDHGGHMIGRIERAAESSGDGESSSDETETKKDGKPE